MTRDPDGHGQPETVTFSVRRSWLHAAAGLAVGLVAGLALGYGATLVATRPAPAPAAAGEAAQAPGKIRAARAGADRPDPAPGPTEMELAGRPARGPTDAPVTLVEFTDFQCPFCARHHLQTKEALLAAYDGRLRYVVRHFPLQTIHPGARRAAEAAECAHDQGAFWAYADLLYARSPAFEPAALVSYAAELELDRERFERCLDGGEKAAVVAADLADARRHGVRSTPTFFVNGRRILGAKPLAAFRAAVDRALEAGD